MGSRKGHTLRTPGKKELPRTLSNKARFVELFLKRKGNIAETCRALRMSRVTFYGWMGADPVFAEEFQQAQEALIDHVESKLRALIDGGDTAATIFFLKTRGKGRGYVERQEHTGADGGPIGMAVTPGDIFAAKKRLEREEECAKKRG